MSDTKALAIRQQQLSLTAWQVIQAIAPTMHQSRLFGVSSPDQAAAIMIKGAELGLSFSASFEFIQVVQGKPTLSPRGALALIHQSAELAGMKIEDKPDACTVWMKRTNGFEYELTFTMDDARRTGQVKPNSAWESYPGNMLRWRCVGFVADVVFPDILGGLKRADEFGAAVDAAGNVIDGEWRAMSPAQAPVPDFAPTVTLDQLVEQYGADRVMEACDGKIPGSAEEVTSAAAVLAGAVAREVQ